MCVNIMKWKAMFKFKQNLGWCFRNVTHLVKQRYKEILRSLNSKKRESGRKVTVRITKNIDAVQEAIKVNNGRLSAGRNGLGITASSFCWIRKTGLRWYPYEVIIRHNRFMKTILKERENFVNGLSINAITEDSWSTLWLGMKQAFTWMTQSTNITFWCMYLFINHMVFAVMSVTVAQRLPFG